MSDKVNHPAHYQNNGIECIDVINFIIGKTGTKFSNGREDLQKAIKNIELLIENVYGTEEKKLNE